jgi:hypothetical protein
MKFVSAKVVGTLFLFHPSMNTNTLYTPAIYIWISNDGRVSTVAEWKGVCSGFFVLV